MNSKKSHGRLTARWPITDVLGTRLSLDYLIGGLRRQLGKNFQLILQDDGAVLEVAKDGRESRLEPALAWLKDRLVSIPLAVRMRRKLSGGQSQFRDDRRIPLLTIALAELPGGAADYDQAIIGLQRRLGFSEVRGPGRSRERAVVLDLDAKDFSIDFIKEPGPVFLMWRRSAGRPGLRPGVFLAAGRGRAEMLWLIEQLKEFPEPSPAKFRVLLDGLEWGVFRKPVVVAAAVGGESIIVDLDFCNRCGLCARICPTGCMVDGGNLKERHGAPCLRCFECVEACPQDALRPSYTHTSAMRGEKVLAVPGWLSRLRGCSGPAIPAIQPPSYLLPKPKPRQQPLYILGLAIITMQEHAAALLKDGRLVGAVEEEKLARIRHYGWPPPGVDPRRHPIEEAFCRRAIRGLLSKEGITLDDVDVIAINGLPARFGRAYEEKPPEVPLPIIKSGRLIFVPHHLCHAASAYRASGMKDAWVLTVDGCGERQTAAVFRASNGSIHQVYELLSLLWRSIGGVYESVTRLLGFGLHGQGIVMALASLGRPIVSMGRYLSWKRPNKLALSVTIYADFHRLARPEGSPLKPVHLNLAASLQKALEGVILSMLRYFLPARPRGLCLAGGVALNCRMNELIRRRFKPGGMFVQPAANDAGTALGAALEACAVLDPRFKFFTMEDAYLGPEFDEAEIEAVLKRSALSYRRLDDVCKEAARLLAQGRVLAWFQGRVEFGPRALGSRSILADPRDPGMKDRMNRIKTRHPWRPFGPSILAGREREWFEEPFDSRFMLFTMPVRKEKARIIPAVLHVDGTTRPQSVHRESNPLYHQLISEFERLTGVPMVLNTSFNRKGEPIVCAPQDAVASFQKMEVDGLVIGPFLAVKGSETSTPVKCESRNLARLPGGRRLALRLTTQCDCDCLHCTMADIRGLPARSFDDALTALKDGRRARCDEVVFLRGEPALWRELPRLAEQARDMGYRFLQLQTNARVFARPGLRERLLTVIDAAEVMLLGADEAVHDELAGASGAFKETLMGMKFLLAADKEVLPSVAVLRHNLECLEAVPVLLHRLGARCVQFNFPRPVQMPHGVRVEALARLSDAAQAVRRATHVAANLGLEVSTEGLPWCHLDEEFWGGTETAGRWDRFRVNDIAVVHDEFGSQIRRERPDPPACHGCRVHQKCPRTWSLYLEIFGSAELQPRV